jgi:hypothetical protein
MWELYQHTYFLNKQRTKYVCIYLDDNMTPQVKIVSSSHHVTSNQIQWFILVTFKNRIPKGEVHELGDSRHTLSMYCGRYVRIMSEEAHVCLSKADWLYFMDLATYCIDKQVIKFGRLQDELMEWRNKCYESRSFCTPPNTNVIDFNALYDELSYKTDHFLCSYNDK